MYNNYGITSSSSSSSLLGNATVGNAVWAIVAFILALVGAFLVYFLFVKTEKKFDNKFLTWLKSFLDFQSMLIETILKIAYIFAAIMITLAPFAFLAAGFAGFIVALITIIFGNLIVRIIYEGVLIKIMIWKNTTEIKKSLKKD